MPSWVPNWSVVPNSGFLDRKLLQSHNRPPIDGQISILKETSGHKTLKLLGYQVDTVHIVVWDREMVQMPVGDADHVFATVMRRMRQLESPETALSAFSWWQNVWEEWVRCQKNLSLQSELLMSLMQGRFGLSTACHQISSWLPLFMERLNTIFLKHWSKDTSPFPCYCCLARLLGSYGAMEEICDQNNEGWHFSLGKESISFGIGPFTMVQGMLSASWMMPTLHGSYGRAAMATGLLVSVSSLIQRRTAQDVVHQDIQFGKMLSFTDPIKCGWIVLDSIVHYYVSIKNLSSLSCH